MDVGVHLPLMEFGEEGQSLERVRSAAEAARDGGFAAVAANDHFLFSTPWLDGLTALAAVIEHTGNLDLATTVALAPLRGPVPLAKALAAIDVLSDGRLIAGVGPGSSQRDYDAVGISFEDRWPRFEESVALLRTLLRDDPVPGRLTRFSLPHDRLAPGPARVGGIPIWIGSWGSGAGLRRVARLADGWLASAYNTTPSDFAAARRRLGEELEAVGRSGEGFPNAVATMWTWVSDDAAEVDRVLREVLAPLLRRDAEVLAARVCVGPPGHCAELLEGYRAVGCERIFIWPLGDEARQLERFAERVIA